MKEKEVCPKENGVLKEEALAYLPEDNRFIEKRYETIAGQVFEMSSPTTKHQEVVGEIYVQFVNFFKGEKCRPFVSPIDVKFNEDNILQPDVVIVCDTNIIKPENISGAPTLVVEVISPSSDKKDKYTKHRVYEEFGVNEYWVVDLTKENVTVHTLNEGLYKDKNVYSFDEKIYSNIFEDLEVSI